VKKGREGKNIWFGRGGSDSCSLFQEKKASSIQSTAEGEGRTDAKGKEKKKGKIPYQKEGARPGKKGEGFLSALRPGERQKGTTGLGAEEEKGEHKES